MRRQRTNRRSGVDLLASPPETDTPPVPAWMDTIIDSADQLEAFASLRDRGFISAEEFERQKAKVLWREDSQRPSERP